MNVWMIFLLKFIFLFFSPVSRYLISHHWLNSLDSSLYCIVYFLFYSLRLTSNCIWMLNIEFRNVFIHWWGHMQYNEAIGCSTIIPIASSLLFGTVSMVTTRKHKRHLLFSFFQWTENIFAAAQFFFESTLFFFWFVFSFLLNIVHNFHNI